MRAWVLLRIKIFAVLIFVGTMLSANKACREDYFFATQSNAGDLVTRTATPDGTGTATPTETPDDGEEDPTETPTPTVSGTVSATPEATAVATPTRTPSAATLGLSLLKQMENLSEEDEEADDLTQPKDSSAPTSASSGKGVAQVSNWLGQIGDKDGVRVIYALSANADYAGSRRQVSRVLSAAGLDVSVVERGVQLEQLLQTSDAPLLLVEAVPTSQSDCAELAALKGQRELIAIDPRDVKPEALTACEAGSYNEMVKAPVTRKEFRTALERSLQRLEAQQKNDSAQ